MWVIPDVRIKVELLGTFFGYCEELIGFASSSLFFVVVTLLLFEDIDR